MADKIQYCTWLVLYFAAGLGMAQVGEYFLFALFLPVVRDAKEEDGNPQR